MTENRQSTEGVRQLYYLHGAALVLYACSFVTDRGVAEDVVQGIFLRLLRQPGPVPERPAAYLFRAVRNAALNARRDRSRDAPLARHEVWLNHPQGGRETALAVEEALRALPEEQMEVVVMRIWGGMTLAEAAEATGVPLNTAASRYRYAIGKLREHLKPYEKVISGEGSA